jgi:four helix bundle protein
MRPYQRFAAGREAHQLALLIYRLTAGWPKRETYGLTAQARRAATSIGANLCEGAARRGAKEFRRFLDLSLGSHAELEYDLALARDLGYLTEADIVEVDGGLRRTGSLLWKLYRAVARQADGTART